MSPPLRAASRPPRAMVWVILLASAVAVLLAGLGATAAILSGVVDRPERIGPAFWLAFGAASVLTVISLGLRSLRWVFLLRRADSRIPIRDAYIGYFAGLSLLFAPLLLGEAAVRAFVHRARGNVPVATTLLVTVWERCADLTALALIVGGIGVAAGAGANSWWHPSLLLAGAATFVGPLRRRGARLAFTVSASVARRFEAGATTDLTRITKGDAWLATVITTVAVWLLPGLGLWAVVNAWNPSYPLVRAEYAYAASTLLGAVMLAPGGVVVVGTQLLAELDTAGLTVAHAALSVAAVRLATAGVAMVLGWVFVLIHVRTARAAAEHFDAIAEAYDVQIPEARRQALLARKTILMREVLEAHRCGRRGLDVGCGQGWYVERMRELGFDVRGIDASSGQVQRAQRHVGDAALIEVGTALQIRAASEHYDFIYTINVLHHLASIEEQRQAFAEMFRVLRPGGLLLVHEINTRNVLFRLYMGYIFPSLNCIDEGVERWLLPHRLLRYTDAPVVDIRYFTFLPDFVPERLVRWCAPVERLLEQSPLGVYSAHYMAVLQKPV